MDIEVTFAKESDLTYIDSLQKKNAEELAFFPKVVFEREVQVNRVLLARVNNEPAGYIYHGALNGTCKIHQACIEYDLRGQLYGRELVNDLIARCNAYYLDGISLRCGSDIEANKFWQAMGFYCEAITKGGARRMRDINCWKLDLQPQLFQTILTPSTKKKDASLWRKRGKGVSQSSMARGKSLQDYRKIIESGDGDKE